MSNFIGVTVNVEEFTRAIKEYERAYTEKDLPRILNDAGLDVAIKASGHTPVATKSAITKALSGRALFRLTNWRRAKKGLPAVGGKAMSAPAIQEMNRRMSSRAYIKSGWTPAIIKFGGHSKAHRALSTKVNQAKNQLASAGELVAILENTAVGAGVAGAEGLRAGMEEAARKMVEHAHKHLEKTARQFSAK